MITLRVVLIQEIIKKSGNDCSAPTGIRRAGWKVVLYLLDGLAYDPEGLGVGTRQFRKAETTVLPRQAYKTRGILLCHRKLR
jgi:hypothetical protein